VRKRDIERKSRRIVEICRHELSNVVFLLLPTARCNCLGNNNICIKDGRACDAIKFRLVRDNYPPR